MALPHASSLQIVNLQPLGSKVPETPSFAIIKGRQLEAIRLVLAAGQGMHQHDTPGEATLLCLEGQVQCQLEDGESRQLGPGDFMHLLPRTRYALQARQDASLLLTLCLMTGQ